MVLTSEQEQLYSATFNATKACWVLAGKAANLHKIGSEWIPILETMDSAARLMMQREGGEGMEQQQNSEEGEEGMEQRIRHRNWANQQRRIWLNTHARLFERTNVDLMATSVQQFLPTIYKRRANGEPIRIVDDEENRQYGQWALGRVEQELNRMHQQWGNYLAKWNRCDAAVREWQHQLNTKIASLQSSPSSSMGALQQPAAESINEEDVWEEEHYDEEEEEYYLMEGEEEEMEMMEEEGGDEYWVEEEEAAQQYHPENIAAQYWQSMLVAQAVEEIEEDVDELEHQFYVSLQHEEEAADEEE